MRRQWREAITLRKMSGKRQQTGTESGGAGTAHGEQKQSGACGVWKFRGLCAIYGSLSGAGNGDALFVRKSAENRKKLAGPYAESI